MRKEREDLFDPSQPALVVTYGNTTRKHRPLTGDLVVVGRSSCCDIGLVSPEVAPIHCVIVNTGDGWRIRDCTGRSGTRLNGRSISDEPLHDGDALQIGTFSFQLNLPAATSGKRQGSPAALVAAITPSQLPGKTLDEAKIAHLKQSRERLARHALNLRRRLRDKTAAPPVPASPVTPSRFDAELGAQRAELDQREKKLRFWEKELTEQDRSLREEYADVEHQRTELQRFAQETLARKQIDLEQKTTALLAERREQLEAELEDSLAARQKELAQLASSLSAREHELAQKRRRLEEQIQKGLAGQKAELAATVASLQQKQRDLDEQLQQVEEINFALVDEREALRLERADAAREREALRAQVETQVREAEEYVQTLWQQCEAHRQKVEAEHGPLVTPADDPIPAQDLDLRAREQAAYARHLRRTRETLGQYEKELAEAYQQFQAEYDTAVREAQTIKERAVEEADAIRRGVGSGQTSADTERLGDTAHGQPRESDAEAAAQLVDEQVQETERVRAEFLAQLAAERNRVEKAESQVKFLRIDLNQLQHELRQRDEVLDHLRAELSQREEKLRPASVDGEIVLAAPERLLALVEKLQKDVAERDDRIRELQRSMQNSQQFTEHVEREAYEVELNRYRIELEQDRILLNEEIARLEIVRAELDEARHETELNVSRERVQIAREWAELNRIREQLRREGKGELSDSVLLAQLRREQAKSEPSDNGLRERPTKPKPVPKVEAVEATPVPTPTAAPPQDLIARLRPTSKHAL